MGRLETWEDPICIFSTFVVVECRSLRAEAKRLVKLPYTLSSDKNQTQRTDSYWTVPPTQGPQGR